MLKIFTFDILDIYLDIYFNTPENFTRTFAGKGNQDVSDLTQRSSWTYKHQIYGNLPQEMDEFIKMLGCQWRTGSFQLLKYETGDFFLTHRDTNLSNATDGEHLYTCLIFCPFEGSDDLEGGELVFQHLENLYYMRLNPSIEIRKGKFIAVIFSIDMNHEVLPILDGIRWVLKTPLFASESTNNKVVREEVDDLCDGGGSYFGGVGGGKDY